MNPSTSASASSHRAPARSTSVSGYVIDILYRWENETSVSSCMAYPYISEIGDSSIARIRRPHFTPSPRFACSSQLHVLAYNPANFIQTLALPKEVEHWSLTTLREKFVRIGARVVVHGRCVTFQLAEVAVPRELFRKILSLIDDLRLRPAPARPGEIGGQVKTTEGVCLNGEKSGHVVFQTKTNLQN